jgi:ubiquinone biosynthesis protein COQ9
MQEYERTTEALLDAALPHVAFEGWSPAAFRAARQDAGIAESAARAACPRGAVDLAAAFHRRGDRRMEATLLPEPLEEMKVRERITHAVRTRIEAIENREAARRAATLFSMPHLAPEGTRLIWGTADAIWVACGDASDDVAWYTKRATLSGVYGSTVLFWLGDETHDHHETWEFLDRRIADVMSFEKLKGSVAANPVLRTVLAGPLWALGRVKAPPRMPRTDMPGLWPGPEEERDEPGPRAV